MDNDFALKIRRENGFKALSAMGILFLVSILGWGALSVFREVLTFERILVIFGILLLLACWATWSIRGAQRHDLYTVVCGSTITQLKRFRGELDDAIEKLELERSQNRKILPYSRGEKKSRKRSSNNLSASGPNE